MYENEDEEKSITVINSHVSGIFKDITNYISEKYNFTGIKLTQNKIYVDTEQLIGIRTKMSCTHTFNLTDPKICIDYISCYIEKIIADKTMITIFDKFVKDHGGVIHCISDSQYESASYVRTGKLLRNHYIEFRFKNMLMVSCNIDDFKDLSVLTSMYEKCIDIYDYISQFVDLSIEFYEKYPLIISCYITSSMIQYANMLLHVKDEHMEKQLRTNLYNLKVNLTTDHHHYTYDYNYTT